MQIRVLKKESEKDAFIRQLSNEKRALLFFYDEEPEKDMLYEKVSEFVTLVHPPYEYGALEKWLYLGNWQAIFPNNKDFNPFDTFRTSSSEIEQRMKEGNIQLIIDSFHDNTEWNVIEAI